MPEIKAVIFDMDGVLFDTERLCTKAWKEVAAQESIPDIDTPILECIGRNEHDTKQIMLRLYGNDFPYEDFKKKVADYFYQFIDREGMPIMKGVEEVLNYLRSKNYRIALASSSPRKSVEHHLLKAGISDYFEKLITGDMVIHGKPDPEIYQLACKELGVEPKLAVAIEDSYNGIRSAHTAGMYAIMVPDMLEPTEEMRQLSFAVCDSLLQIKNIL